MPEPIEFQAIRNLRTTLQGITAAAGYHYGVAALAVKLDPNHDVEVLIAPDGPRPFILLEVLTEQQAARRDYEAAQQLRVVLPVTIHWVGEADQDDDESRLRTFLRGCADVEQAIATDVERGGTATDTRIVRQVLDQSTDGRQVWAVLDCEIWLHRQYGRPNG